MQAQYEISPYARPHKLHGPKKQLLGHQVQPAWRPNVAQASSSAKRSQAAQGSKIFLSRLPVDVGEKEVEELFKKTIGPVTETFLIYNSQGKSKGMAIVSFTRASDAAAAREKYHGMIVDGRRPLKIEIITDGVPVAAAAPQPPPAAPSLLQRLGGLAPSASALTQPTPPRHQNPSTQRSQPKAKAVAAGARSAPVPVPPRRVRTKKGPKRLKKREPATIADLDKEMDDYRAAAENVFSML